MSEFHNPDLLRAYELIEDDQLEAARAVLDSYLEDHQEDADAWWLYAHAVTEPIEAQNALRNVLRIDADYPEARMLLSETESILTPKAATSAGISQLSSRTANVEDTFGDAEFGAIPDFLDRLDTDEFAKLGADADDDFSDDFDDDFDDFSNDQKAEAVPSKRRWLLLLPILALVALVAIFALLNNRQKEPTVVENTAIPSGASTQVAQEPTNAEIAGESTSEVAPPTSTVIPEGAPESTTNASDFTALQTALSAYNVVDTGIESVEIGDVLVATVCNDASIGLINTALGVMDIIAQEGVQLEQSPDYVGARIVDCTRDNLALRSLGISFADAQAFADGSLSLAELRSKLQVLQLAN